MKVSLASAQGLAVSDPSSSHEREAEQREEVYRQSSHGTAAAGTSAAAAAGPEISGARLPAALEAHFSQRLGHSFANVRLHHDADADAGARRLSAAAFTVGNNIFFRAGLFAPTTDRGRALLAHELTHVRQQELTGPRVDRKVFTQEELEDMQPPSTTPELGQLGTDPALERFKSRLAAHYQVQTVRKGTFGDQAEAVASEQVTLPAGVTRGTLDKSKWKEWSPPSGWATYKAILDAIDTFVSGFGGAPQIKEVVFFDLGYGVNETTGAVEPQPGKGASFGNGQLTVYAAASTGNALPTGRSGVPYAGSQSTLVKPASEKEAIEHNITHELGHGVAEMAMNPPGDGRPAPDKDMIEDYEHEMGWTPFRPATGSSPAVNPRLYDVGVAAVRDALKDGKDPPDKYRLTLYNWNEGHWIEQPISAYSIDNPGDDFAESVSAFVRMPQILKDRSPRRYKFIESHKDRWLAKAPPSLADAGSAARPTNQLPATNPPPETPSR